jgi:hypothetical protein
MKATEAIQTALKSTQFVLTTWLSDLSDSDLLVRPAPGANHLAWQLGHLIHSEVMLVKMGLPDAVYPALPDGFGKQHDKETCGQEPPKGFLSKGEYLNLFTKVRQATVEHLAKLSDSDLDKPTTGKMAQFAPTLGALLLLVSNHTLMHGGQVCVLRRKLNKPILI